MEKAGKKSNTEILPVAFWNTRIKTDLRLQQRAFHQHINLYFDKIQKKNTRNIRKFSKIKKKILNLAKILTKIS